MPIFDYECEECGHCFEEIVLVSDYVPSCPKCQGKKVRKLITKSNIRPQGIPTGSGGFKVPECMNRENEYKNRLSKVK